MPRKGNVTSLLDVSKEFDRTKKVENASAQSPDRAPLLSRLLRQLLLQDQRQHRRLGHDERRLRPLSGEGGHPDVRDRGENSPICPRWETVVMQRNHVSVPASVSLDLPPHIVIVLLNVGITSKPEESSV